MYVPTDYNKTSGDRPLKKIMVPHGMPEAKVGPDIFLQHRCPVNTCTIIRDNAEEADLILFQDYITHVGRRSSNQVCKNNVKLLAQKLRFFFSKRSINSMVAFDLISTYTKKKKRKEKKKKMKRVEFDFYRVKFS